MAGVLAMGALWKLQETVRSHHFFVLPLLYPWEDPSFYIINSCMLAPHPNQHPWMRLLTPESEDFLGQVP